MSQINYIRTVIVDTVSTIGSQMVNDNNKQKAPEQRDWFDIGAEIWRFVYAIKTMRWFTVLNIAMPKGGKSMALKNCAPGTILYINTDEKDLPYMDVDSSIGTTENPGPNMIIGVRTFDQILARIGQLIKAGTHQFHPKCVFIMNAHAKLDKATETRIVDMQYPGRSYSSHNVPAQFDAIIKTVREKRENLQKPFPMILNQGTKDDGFDYYFDLAGDPMSIFGAPDGLFRYSIMPCNYTLLTETILAAKGYEADPNGWWQLFLIQTATQS